MRLLHAFMIAASSLFWAGPQANGQQHTRFDSTRKLTEAEATLVKTFFGETLELRYLELSFLAPPAQSSMTIIGGHMSPALMYPTSAPPAPKNSAETVSTYFCDDGRPAKCQLSQYVLFNWPSAVNDFTQEKGYEYATFFHEMTHVWQHQKEVEPKRLARPKPKKDLVYPYKLDSLSSFNDYGIEQQATIVGDYVRAFMLVQPERITRHAGRVTPVTLVLLQRVVEEKFPGAALLRLETERKRNALLEAKMQKKKARLEKRLKPPVT